MDDDKLFDDDAPKKEDAEGKEPAGEGSGLGNLPPLSEFDSKGGFDSDGDLPPLGDFETKDDEASEGGTPPSDAGQTSSEGAFDSSFPGGVESSDSQSEAADETPPESRQSRGFQDLAADSDFSPETPDIGPGPDSTLDTPIFDSAFGGDEAIAGGDQASNATQAMESPMFDDFGDDAEFGTPEGATPMPDFSPDTGFGDLAGVGAGPSAPEPAGARPPGEPTVVRKGVNPLVVVVFGLIALIIGIVTSPFLADYLAFLPNPLRQEIEQRDAQIRQQEITINRLREVADPDDPLAVDPARLEELQEQILAHTQELEAVNNQLDSARTSLEQQQLELAGVESDLRERNDEIIAAREFLEDLRNETAIVQARQRGLISEVDRLTGYVGELEEANARRLATKEALEHNIDRLIIQVQESIPLTPEKFDHADRLATVRALRERAAQAGWVTPELQNEYTSMYLRELEIAQSSEYFFARIPVTDRFGHRSYKWAECLMRGNWAVYYRTLDGRNIGSFENTGTPETPLWGFKEDLPDDAKSSIEAYIIGARVPDFESQAQLLAERELAGQDGNVWQRTYSSL